MTVVTTRSGDDEQSKTGMTESQRKVAISLLQLGERHEIIAKATGLPISIIATLCVNHNS